jgi:hypothetical protein
MTVLPASCRLTSMRGSQPQDGSSPLQLRGRDSSRLPLIGSGQTEAMCLGSTLLPQVGLD